MKFIPTYSLRTLLIIVTVFAVLLAAVKANFFNKCTQYFDPINPKAGRTVVHGVDVVFAVDGGIERATATATYYSERPFVLKVENIDYDQIGRSEQLRVEASWQLIGHRYRAKIGIEYSNRSVTVHGDDGEQITFDLADDCCSGPDSVEENNGASWQSGEGGYETVMEINQLSGPREGDRPCRSQIAGAFEFLDEYDEFADEPEEEYIEEPLLNYSE